MDAIINQFGELRLKRGNIYKIAHCPFTTSKEDVCGDWCPLFGEIKFEVGYEQIKSKLNLCHTIIVGEIVDERK